MEELEERQLRIRPVNAAHKEKGGASQLTRKTAKLLKESWKQALILLNPMQKGDIDVLRSHSYKLVITGHDEAVPVENSPGLKIIREPTSRPGLKTNHEADTIVTAR